MSGTRDTRCLEDSEWEASASFPNYLTFPARSPLVNGDLIDVIAFGT